MEHAIKSHDLACLWLPGSRWICAHVLHVPLRASTLDSIGDVLCLVAGPVSNCHACFMAIGRTSYFSIYNWELNRSGWSLAWGTFATQRLILKKIMKDSF